MSIKINIDKNKHYIILIILLVLGCQQSSHVEKTVKKNEAYYQKKWCSEHNGITEYILQDRTRVDCLTDTHAIEVDFAGKWAESIGQSLFYGAKTKKKPGIVLIIVKEKDIRYYQRLEFTKRKYTLPVDIFPVDKNGNELKP